MTDLNKALGDAANPFSPLDKKLERCYYHFAVHGATRKEEDEIMRRAEAFPRVLSALKRLMNQHVITDDPLSPFYHAWSAVDFYDKWSANGKSGQ